MADCPITSPDSAVYEISGEIDADATGLVFGALLGGDGQIWVDAFDECQRPPRASFEESGEMPAGWYAGADNYLFELSDTRVPLALTDADARAAGADAQTLAEALDAVPVADLTAADADLRSDEPAGAAA